MVDVGVEDAYGFLLHLRFDDSELHPPIIWNRYVDCEVTEGCLLHKSLNENLLIGEDVVVVVKSMEF